MAKLTDDRLVQDYLAWCEADEAQPLGSPMSVAWATMADLADDDPERAWALLLRVVTGAGLEGSTLCSAGTDCLENLVRAHGEQFIDRIEAQARTDPKFLQASACVWAWSSPVRSRLDDLLRELNQPLL